MKISMKRKKKRKEKEKKNKMVDIKIRGTIDDIKRYEPYSVIGDVLQNTVTGQLYACFTNGTLKTISSIDEAPSSGGETVYWSNIVGKPNTFNPSTHTHPAAGGVTEVDAGSL